MIFDNMYEFTESPSARKVWIEMLSNCEFTSKYWVTFREEGVD